MLFKNVNHIAIIVSDITEAKKFYVDILGFEIIDKLDRSEQNKPSILYLNAGNITIELFSVADAPKRLSYPEAKGLRHLAFTVHNFNKTVEKLKKEDIKLENIRFDERTGKRMTFFSDPDGLPLEICEE